MQKNHVLIDVSLQQKVLTVLDDRHPGICNKKSIARSLVWYSGIDREIAHVVKSHPQCIGVCTRPNQNSTIETPQPAKNDLAFTLITSFFK